MATAQPLMAPLSPLLLDSFTSLDDWLHLDQAGDNIGLPDSPSDSPLFSPDKLSTLDFSSHPHDPTAAFSLEALFQTARSDASALSPLDPAALLALPHTLTHSNPTPAMATAPLSATTSSTTTPPFASASASPVVITHALANAVSSSHAAIDVRASSSLALTVDPHLTAPTPIHRLATPPDSVAPSSPSTMAPSPHDNDHHSYAMDVIVEESSVPADDDHLYDPAHDDDIDDDQSAQHMHTMSSATVSAKKVLSHPHALVEVPEWADRPSAEEYKKLSSKEKRQLRNKISARNFRHRRKEHISTLEQQVAERDECIASLRGDLGAVKSENTRLRAEVESLKSKWADLMKKIEDMSLAATTTQSTSPPLSSLSSSSMMMTTSRSSSPTQRSRLSSASSSVSSSGATTPTTTTTPIPKANLFKDIGSHSMKAFHGAAGLPNNNVNVHGTYVMCA